MMKNAKHIRVLPWLFLALSALVAFSSCDKDEEEVEQETIRYYEWYASGDDVAALFRSFPMLTDSIYLQFRSQVDNILAPDVVNWRIYIERFKTDGSVTVLTGNDQPAWGARIHREESPNDGILSFHTLNAEENGTSRVIRGIFQEVPGDNAMMMEFVYDHWGIGPPDPDEGFGSTADGAYGDNNVHVLTKIPNGEETDTRK